MAVVRPLVVLAVLLALTARPLTAKDVLHTQAEVEALRALSGRLRAQPQPRDGATDVTQAAEHLSAWSVEKLLAIDQVDPAGWKAADLFELERICRAVVDYRSMHAGHPEVAWLFSSDARPEWEEATLIVARDYEPNAILRVATALSGSKAAGKRALAARLAFKLQVFHVGWEDEVRRILLDALADRDPHVGAEVVRRFSLALVEDDACGTRMMNMLSDKRPLRGPELVLLRGGDASARMSLGEFCHESLYGLSFVSRWDDRSPRDGGDLPGEETRPFIRAAVLEKRLRPSAPTWTLSLEWKGPLALGESREFRVPDHRAPFTLRVGAVVLRRSGTDERLFSAAKLWWPSSRVSEAVDESPVDLGSRGFAVGCYMQYASGSPGGPGNTVRLALGERGRDHAAVHLWVWTTEKMP